MSLSGVVIQKGQLGANRLGGEDSISALVVCGALVEPSEVAILEPKVVYSITDVKALGIDQAYDDANDVVVFRHLKEFYRVAPEGTKLYLMLTGNAVDDGAMEDAKVLMHFAKGEIKQLAFAIADSSAVATVVDGLRQDVRNAIALGQALHDWSYTNFMPVQILLESPGIVLPASSVLDLRAIENLDATKVSLVIGNDYTYAQSLPATLQKYADAGTALGIMARAKVHENIGDNEQYNLTDATRAAWLEAGISGNSNSEVAEQLQTLDTKGYLFGVTYPGLAGVRFNNDHVCAPVVLDAENNMNEHTIAYGRVADKAVRELRRAYLPKVKTTWNVDSTTGKLSSGTIVALEDIGDQVFDDMLERGEISYGKAKVDPDSDLLVEKVLRVSYVIVPKGTINKIEGTLNLKTRE